MGNGVWRGQRASGEFLQHLIHLVCVDPSIHPPNAVRGHLPEVVLQSGDEVVKARGMVEASCLLNVGNGETVHRFFVLDPEGGIPGFVVCPTVEGLTLGDHGLECFHRSFVCCVYPSRSAGQSRSLIDQFPHCPSGAGSRPWRIRSRRAVSALSWAM